MTTPAMKSHREWLYAAGTRHLRVIHHVPGSAEQIDADHDAFCCGPGVTMTATCGMRRAWGTDTDQRCRFCEPSAPRVDDEEVERVARVIYDAVQALHKASGWGVIKWEDSLSSRDEAYVAARAVLAHLREGTRHEKARGPTEEEIDRMARDFTKVFMRGRGRAAKVEDPWRRVESLAREIRAAIRPEQSITIEALDELAALAQTNRRAI